MYSDIKKNKAASLKKLKITLILSYLIMFIALQRSIAIMIIFGLLGVVYSGAFTGAMKNHYKKLEDNLEWSNEEFHSEFKISGMNRVFIMNLTLVIPYLLLMYIYSDIIYNDYSTSVFLAITSLILILSLISFWFLKKHFESSHLLFTEGFEILGVKYPFSEFRKYQFMKLRKGGYIFEARLNKSFLNLNVTEDQKNLIETLMKSGCQ